MRFRQDGVRVGFGAMRLSTPDVGAAEAERLVQEAFERGIRLFDTADVYAPSAEAIGHNERLLARALGGRSRDVTIATKGGLRRSGKKWLPDGRARHLTAACEQSLRALETDCIDLYLLHAVDPKVPIETSLRALAKLQAQGKIRNIGVCNVRLEELERALELVSIAAVQVELSPLSLRAFKNGVVSACARRGIPVLAHSPLGGHRKAKGLPRIEVLGRVGERHGVSAYEVALAWLLAAAPGIAPLPGVTRRETLRSCVHAAEIRLTDRDLEELDEALPAGRSIRSPRPAPADPREGEIVLMMGYPAAGKSTEARRWVERGYVRLSRDDMGGRLSDVLAELERALDAGERRIVLDNTYPRRESRFDVVDVAASRGVAVRCVVVETSLEQSQVNAVRRMLSRYGRLLDADELSRESDADANTFLPDAQFRYRRELEPARDDEGFQRIDRVPFEASPPAAGTGRALFLDAVESTPEWRDASGQAREAGYRLLRVSYEPGATRPQGEAEPEGVWSYYCPHPPGPPVCWCRKPLPGLGMLLVEQYGLDAAQCVVVGDSAADRGFASRLGMASVTVAEFLGGVWMR